MHTTCKIWHKRSMTQTQQFRAGVVGAGAFGANHVRKYAEHGGVQLAAVYDRDLPRAQALAAPHGALATDDLGVFLQHVDIVTVAAPAVVHAEIACAALKAGKHVYVEKPLAATVAEADAILAAQGDRVLACGHQERAVFAAMGLLDIPERPISLEATRAGVWSGRGADVTVTLDLMVHDLDLCLALGLDDLVIASATGQRVHSASVDAITARYAAGGTTVTLTASRMAPERSRHMTIIYPSGRVRIDFVARMFENTTPFALNPDFADTPAGRDPLGTSVGAFITAVQNPGARPLVSGGEARAALALALAADTTVHLEVTESVS